MATIVNMLPVTVPRFASSSSQVQDPPSQSLVQTSQWSSNNGEVHGAGDLDFDLLAEYLLDDSTAIGVHMNGMPQFDFSEATSGTGFISPEQSEDGNQENTNGSHPNGSTFSSPQPLLAPAGSLLTSNGMAISLHHSISPVQQAHGTTSYSILPTQVLAPLQSSPSLTVHQHLPNIAAPNPALSGPKRKRVDMPTPVYAVGTSLQVPHYTANGQMVGMVSVAGRGRQKSQAQIDRRRERNRILARRTRLRKKFFFESLQKEVNDLQRENNSLKDLVKKHFNAEDAKQLLSECNAMASLPRDVQEAVFENADLDNQDFNLVRSIQRSQQCFIITDPSLQDNPIVYASDDFLSLTGYDRDEVLGRNCRFLQGTETSAEKVEKLRKSISLGEDVSVTLINYTADGTAFWNKLFIAALRDAHNNIVNFIGVIVKVATPDAEDPEAGKRLPGEQASSSNGDMELGDDDDYDEDFSG